MVLDYDGFFGWWSDDRRLVKPPGCWRNWAVGGWWNCLLHLSKLSCKNWATRSLCETELLSADAGFGVLKELSNLNLVKCFLKMMFHDFGCVRKIEQFWTCEKCFLQMSDLVHILKELSIHLDFVEMASGRCCIWKVLQKEWSNQVASFTWWILSVCLKKWVSNQLIIQSWTPEKSCLSAGDVGFSNNASRLLSNLDSWKLSCAVGCWIQQSHELFFQAIWSIVKISQTF